MQLFHGGREGTGVGVGAVDNALTRISNRWSKLRDLVHPLTSRGLPLESKVNDSQLVCIALFYIRVKLGLLKKKKWSN